MSAISLSVEPDKRPAYDLLGDHSVPRARALLQGSGTTQNVLLPHRRASERATAAHRRSRVGRKAGADTTGLSLRT